MNKLKQIKLKQQLKKIKITTQECSDFLNVLKDSLDNQNGVVVFELENVIKHQNNMVHFFGILENELSK
ncbi:hypothetical protein D3C76_316340 [compost metagenome]